MLEELKKQIQDQVTKLLSSFSVSTNFALFGIALLTGFTAMLALELLLPGITQRLSLIPYVILIFAILFLSAAAILYLKKPALLSPDPTLLPDPENMEKYFNYCVADINVSYKTTSKNRAIFEDERTYLASGDIQYPAQLVFMPLMSRVKIRLLEVKGYKPAKNTTLRSLKKWRDSIILMTDFKGPVEQTTKNLAYIKIEVKGNPLPNHLYAGSRYPLKGKINFKLDLKQFKKRFAKARLLTFTSSRASRPLIPRSKSPIQYFNGQNKLSCSVEKPIRDFLYVLSWKEPCNCSWCRRINFN